MRGTTRHPLLRVKTKSHDITVGPSLVTLTFVIGGLVLLVSGAIKIEDLMALLPKVPAWW